MQQQLAEAIRQLDQAIRRAAPVQRDLDRKLAELRQRAQPVHGSR